MKRGTLPAFHQEGVARREGGGMLADEESDGVRL